MPGRKKVCFRSSEAFSPFNSLLVSSMLELVCEPPKRIDGILGGPRISVEWIMHKGSKGDRAMYQVQ